MPDKITCKMHLMYLLSYKPFWVHCSVLLKNTYQYFRHYIKWPAKTGKSQPLYLIAITFSTFVTWGVIIHQWEITFVSHAGDQTHSTKGCESSRGIFWSSGNLITKLRHFSKFKIICYSQCFNVTKTVNNWKNLLHL